MSEKREVYNGARSFGLLTIDGSSVEGFPVLSDHQRWESDVNGKLAQVLARLDNLEKSCVRTVGEKKESTVIRTVRGDIPQSVYSSSEYQSLLKDMAAANSRATTWKDRYEQSFVVTQSQAMEISELRNRWDLQLAETKLMSATIADLREQLEVMKACRSEFYKEKVDV